MIITCYDCPHPTFGPDVVKTWRYACDDCAQEYVDKHRATGHHVETRAETYSDTYAYSSL